MKSCWCGNEDLVVFSADYFRCSDCETLVLKQHVGPDVGKVENDQIDFYGKQYYQNYLPNVRGLPDLATRARTDLRERCVYWLRTVLKYKLPPADLLEIGSAHGGFVALLRQAGFNGQGLELSPWLVEFARITFDVPILRGPAEEQKLALGSLDGVLLMDVLEHLPDPLITLQYCCSWLRPDGIFVIQTPRYPEGRTYQSMLDNDDPFLKLLVAPEHIFLFSRSSIVRFLRQLGMLATAFEPSLFHQHDMFVVAGRSQLHTHDAKTAEDSLINTVSGRFAMALLDLYAVMEDKERALCECNADRAERLEIIHKLTKELAVVEADRAARLNIIEKLVQQLDGCNVELAEQRWLNNLLDQRARDAGTRKTE